MERQESRRIAVAFGHLVDEGADAARISTAVVSTLREVHDALCPLIGNRGVALLYKRSLYLAGQTHPVLAGLHEGVDANLDATALGDVLSRESAAAAAACGGDLLQTFYELLSGLIGPSLTGRILSATWTNPSGNSPKQGSTSP